ncbi:hypothetical protein SAMN05421761_104166 [Belliella pelovolcani]|jgi:hypothetical protein|uniref:Uncharacterized protein n=1 Tax=Belliella pelovolcani TaxID=529505 RepID=A0A1N7LW61_9BACT|nr:hypothetical protein SAMN05421761_104166 [Belliella pelovolcani]
METLFSLLMLTAIYGLTILSVIPDRFIRKLSHSMYHKQAPDYKKFSLGGSIFLSFLVGYIFASVMVYFII